VSVTVSVTGDAAGSPPAPNPGGGDAGAPRAFAASAALPSPVPSPGQSLQSFTLDDLAVYTREGEFAPGDSSDFRTFYAGRDDVHGVLKHLYSRVTVSVKMTMFGYDDVELNDIIVNLILSQHVYFQGTLDESQAATPTEKRILDAWSSAVRSSFAIKRSATGQIEHTKGGVLDGRVAYEGSTNWSSSGEGTGIGLHGAANAVGYKAQANTLTVYTNLSEIQKFATRMDEEHVSVLQKAAG